MKITEAIILLCEQLREWKEYTETDQILIHDWRVIDVDYFIVKNKYWTNSALPSEYSEEMIEHFNKITN